MICDHQKRLDLYQQRAGTAVFHVVFLFIKRDELPGLIDGETSFGKRNDFQFLAVEMKNFQDCKIIYPEAKLKTGFRDCAHLSTMCLSASRRISIKMSMVNVIREDPP